MTLLPSGAIIVDLILCVMAAEAVLLVLLRLRSGRGLPVREIVTTLAAGLCLLLALRAALQGAGEVAVTLWLAAAGIAHLLDIVVRWPPARTPGPLQQHPSEGAHESR